MILRRDKAMKTGEMTRWKTVWPVNCWPATAVAAALLCVSRVLYQSTGLPAPSRAV